MINAAYDDSYRRELALEDEVPSEFLSRGDYMAHIKFPENSPSLVIIPSNKKGTGFIKTCYDP